ncbi:hypothetical protein L2E82_33147 [Cichorium intybus]|uniref:Uncharacterized protein n=1 Tax=Cichorium intybus TaxID=13427 RepID=A0ACB9BJD4_CICIN|nr:hypothetical protein L2E82_33147 [Cichorium intybus]
MEKLLLVRSEGRSATSSDDDEIYFDRGNFYDFTSLVRELDVPGELYERKTFPFEFSSVEMPYETYNGVNVRLRNPFRCVVAKLPFDSTGH